MILRPTNPHMNIGRWYIWCSTPWRRWWRAFIRMNYWTGYGCCWMQSWKLLGFTSSVVINKWCLKWIRGVRRSMRRMKSLHHLWGSQITWFSFTTRSWRILNISWHLSLGTSSRIQKRKKFIGGSICFWIHAMRKTWIKPGNYTELKGYTARLWYLKWRLTF